MPKLNGSLKFVIAIVVIAVVAIVAVVRLSSEPNSGPTITSILGFAGMLAKQFFDSARTAAAFKKTNIAIEQTAAKVDTVTARTDEVVAKVGEVHEAVNGLNKAALKNQASVSDRIGFDRGVEAQAAAQAATEPSGKTTLIPPVYDPRDVAPPGKE